MEVQQGQSVSMPCIGEKAADAFSVATPADRRPGDDVIVPTAGSCGVAKDKVPSLPSPSTGSSIARYIAWGTTMHGIVLKLAGKAVRWGTEMRRLAGILVLLAAAPAAFTEGVAEPKAELKRFEVSAISLRDITFLFEVAVKNPYPVALPFDGMTLGFSVEGAKVFTAASQGGFTVPASGSKSNAFTVALAYEDVIKAVREYTSKDYLRTVIDGTLSIPLPKLRGLPKSFTFDWSLQKMIPAIKPRIAVLDFRVVPPTQGEIKDALAKAGRNLDATTVLGALRNVLEGKKPAASAIDPSEIDVPVSVSFTIELANEAKAALSFAKLGYELAVNGDRLVAGESTDVVQDAGRSLITVVSTFSSRSLSQNIRRLFQDRKGTFALHGTAAVKLPDEIRKDPVPLEFEEGGSFAVHP
jgi:LEA14-like dessication related protein